jgi:hypothetical protein
LRESQFWGYFVLERRRKSKKMRFKGTEAGFWVSLLIENDVIMAGEMRNMCLIL